MTIIDVTPGLEGYRVWIADRLYAKCALLTSASRVATALRTLETYGLLDTVSMPRKPTLRLVADRAAAGIVRDMLKACPEVAS